MTNVPSKVSIIVPVYNVENYLAKCLDSLINQTHQNIEILVVNDGSKDNSEQIIQNYAQKYPEKIKPFVKENGGLSDARNFGVDRATGDYIGFVDSDDYVTPTMFEEMVNLAEKHYSKMVICNIQKVDQNGNVTQKLTQIPNMPEKIDLNKNFSVFSDLSYFACNKLFKKELFNGKRFKKGAHFEDIQLIPQLLLECETIAQTQNFHYQYLERTDSITKTHTEKGLDILKAVEEVEMAFEQSRYSGKRKELKNFQIFEGVYSFLAYLAFVKDEKLFYEMSSKLGLFMKKRNIKIKDILKYSRFDKNYLLSLPLKKKIFYLLFFAGQKRLIRKLV
ncbi:MULTISPECIES: glycosyltransferase family 2 protein [Chryseobacterium]|uniref:Glycosyltransferase involved in cell wall biosynthesis n=1 Tax=Chryseobacterium geocarposphaerae TaxID=1416776 RepID=A0ABU1LIE7_9FLAO|nr:MULTISPECIES: glycosyltransferase family 2 protein [Chryseobacterium]MDR6406320.1 glycosyltransferase involved in cell wall biosynthesis [Chryseobacterium geocarposphaerae]MDR6699659.1 glycosyltransferase involved in cell wall biosynthesis [Chryseobacterium ginsenosidimutans]